MADAQLAPPARGLNAQIVAQIGDLGIGLSPDARIAEFGVSLHPDVQHQG